MRVRLHRANIRYFTRSQSILIASTHRADITRWSKKAASNFGVRLKRRTGSWRIGGCRSSRAGSARGLLSMRSTLFLNSRRRQIAAGSGYQEAWQSCSRASRLCSEDPLASRNRLYPVVLNCRANSAAPALGSIGDMRAQCANPGTAWQGFATLSTARSPIPDDLRAIKTGWWEGRWVECSIGSRRSEKALRS